MSMRIAVRSTSRNTRKCPGFGSCEMFDYACNAHFFIMEIDVS